MELNQLNAMILQEKSRTRYYGKEHGLMLIILQEKKVQRQTKYNVYLLTIPNGRCLVKYLKDL